ncbi:hypothetical protein OAG56_02400 [Mariniblastus sp.]|jgi:uncharacterized Zn finger protein|nr:hypothetical protein [Mariniblastus sp.]MDB4756197.1 hypothetical protein [Mariniblastus sp.]
MLCPRCDQQGQVELVVIKKTGERVLRCDECDALRQNGDEVMKSNLVDFSTYVAQFGVIDTWDEIETINAADK